MPEDIAKMAAHLSSKNASYITGAGFYVRTNNALWYLISRFILTELRLAKFPNVLLCASPPNHSIAGILA